MTLLSVILPVRNGAVFLAEALQSIADQTHEDFEVLVQDDGSSDTTPQILADWAERDPRFKPETQQPLGVAHAANRAAARARGDLLVRMDGDDVCRPERLAALLDLMQTLPDVDYAGSRTHFFGQEAVSAGMRRYETWLNSLLSHEDIHGARFVEYPIANPSKIVRRRLHETLGGYRQDDLPEDYDFFLRAATQGARFAKHPDVLLDWREGDHRATRSDPRYGMDRFHRVMVRELLQHIGSPARKLVLVGVSRPGKRWLTSLRDAGHAPAHLIDPTGARAGHTVGGVRVEGPGALPAPGEHLCLLVTRPGHEAPGLDLCLEQGWRPVEGLLMIG